MRAWCLYMSTVTPLNIKNNEYICITDLYVTGCIVNWAMDFDKLFDYQIKGNIISMNLGTSSYNPNLFIKKK